MTRNKVAATLVLVVSALAVWLVYFRHPDDAKSPPAPEAKAVATRATPAKAAAEEPAPRGRAPQWIIDADPEGSLRLEGQVVADDGHGVGGAVVWLQSVPPRLTKTDDDGSFAFDKLVGRAYSLTASHAALVG